MRGLLKVFLAVFALFIGGGIGLYIYLGGYKEVTMQPGTVPYTFQIIYKEHVGAYHKIMNAIGEVEKWAAANNVACSRTFGLFFDDPKTVDEDRLRSQGGCVVENAPDLPADIKIGSIDFKDYLKAEFLGSPSIGPFKVYPKVLRYLSDNKMKISGPVMEVYTIQGPKAMKTEYFFPVQFN